MYRIVILVIGSRKNAVVRTDKTEIKTEYPKKIYDQFILKYWKKFSEYLKIHHKNVKLFYIFGSIPIDDLNLPKEDVLMFDMKESYDNILKKTIESFKYINNNLEYDYVIRTNLSTFIHIKNLFKVIEIIDNLNKPKIYAGPLIINHETKHKFISGISMIFSKLAVKENILENYEKLDLHPYSDDCELGKLFKKEIYDLTNYFEKLVYLTDYNFEKKEYNYNKKDIIDIIETHSKYILRTKNYDRQFDVDLLEYLTNHYYKL